MAKTYLDVYPDARLLMLDSAESIGGTWSANRLYPGLHSNNLVGSYEYSDFPLDRSARGISTGEHIPGPKLHQYLQDFAAEFDLTRRTKLNAKVEVVERLSPDEWKVSYRDASDTVESVFAKKLVIATGLTNNPFIPQFPGQDTFETPVFHVRYLNDHADQLLKSAKNIILLGGSKSSYDVAYAFASQGVTVDWIIRESGHGANWMSPSLVTPFRKRLEGLVGVRFFTWFSPCIWGDQDGFAWVRKMLHCTWIGRFFVDRFWDILTADLDERTGYNKHPETAKLRPKVPAFWHASSLSILNYPTDVFEYVRNGTIKVHVADIDHLSKRAVYLSDGTELSGDALICSTGWHHRPSVKFLPEGIDAELGIPNHSSEPECKLLGRADKEILSRFPRLKDQPNAYQNYIPLQPTKGEAVVNERPFRLYRFMVPPTSVNHPSIAFLGILLTIHTVPVAQAQALWTTAYLNGQLPAQRDNPTKSFDPDAVAYETILQTQFGKWRYPGAFGKQFPDFVFDAVPYMDMLLRDIGLRFRRKKSWWAEIWYPYGPEDYKGLVDEWRVKVS
ncbi:uncharacterized protein Z519_07956 [Cladophialophora bantiana CBS 173.52]|uniref:L-ornithine N(5)-oxygenase n=1 Tax=Cladophialophora bantiana (strain ATCC 10958 / CBS 173.52 / CDC B-1940 / NIH 8579) TaxID=1442370 RepID=A0A0D2FX48_CLAB1|nr:uncharacterized protein Z519_07956 [Cladophialophora bantiana CBS 173.52]KIW91062.1 hypothetical protein Z519_07956 [Cladophialophora bantiana CBS 173.52]